MTGGGSSIADSAAPSMHAIGGSLGSALALLLLYPLERARVELQTTTAASSDSISSSEEGVMNIQNEPLLSQERLGKSTRASRGGGAVAAKQNNAEDIMMRMSMSDSSWESCLKISSLGEKDILSSSPLESSAKSCQPEKILEQKVGLLSCLLQLRQRGQLYRGVAPVVITMAVSNYVFFYMHSFLKQWLTPKGGGVASPELRLSLLTSTLAGIVNVLATNPLWVANLRIVTSENNSAAMKSPSSDNNNKHDNSNNNNLFQEIMHIVKKEGWSHLWNGTGASLLLVSNPVIQFFAYEQLKNALLQLRHSTKGSGSSTLKPLEAFLLGAVAKATSTVLTYPLQLTQTVMRVQQQEKKGQEEEGKSQQPRASVSTSVSNTHYKGTLDCLIKIYLHEGIKGWFSGMQTKLLQTVLTAAFTFLTYEQIIKALVNVQRALAAQSGHHPSGNFRHHSNAPVP